MNSIESSQAVNGGPLPEILLTEIQGEPRARDLDIADRLGFSRPRAIRQTIERHRGEIESFGSLATVCGKSRGQDFNEFWLNEEQALLVAALSNAPEAPTVRALLIRTFVAWRRGHLAPAVDSMVTDLSPAVRAAFGGIVKGIVHKEVAEAATAMCEALLPKMVAAALAAQNIMVRRGKTAGQLLRDAGFPPARGMATWFGNRMAALGYGIDGEGRAELGNTTARIFDPDKVGVWLRAGGRVSVEQKVAERRGQKLIRLVSPVSEATRTY